jgi:hypothetical protein
MMGKKVFVRSDTTPYPYFRELGVLVYDTRGIPGMTLPEIVEFAPESGRRNAEAVRALLSEENAVAGWAELFRTLRGTA